MYLFDTNVLSEVMKPTPHEAVTAWLEACPTDVMATAAICQAEILYGIEKLPRGARRTRLEQAARALFEQTFAGRILSEIRVHETLLTLPGFQKFGSTRLF